MRVVRPSLADPRLRLSAIVGGVQVIGQLGLGFELSIAQILAPIAACAVVEAAITAWRRRELAWPASAILTGNSTALLLRVPGTRHGDWWSTRGIGWFVLAALLGLLAKHVVRTGGRHLYNPSNLGLVLVFLAVRPPQVAPMFLWWGPPSWWLAAVYVLVVAGGAWVLWPLGLLRLSLFFLGPFAVLTALLATGDCFVAIWHSGQVCGADLWLNLALSPEVMVFAFLMLPDPRTVPASERGREAFGIAAATIAVVLIAVQRSEYGVKVAILAALAALTPFAVRRPRPVLVAAGLASFALAWATAGLALDEGTVESDLPGPAGAFCQPPATGQTPPGCP